MNRHPLGTKIKVQRVYLNGHYIGRKIAGLRNFIVRDRIGWGTELDFWSDSCAWSNAFGRRTVKYSIR